MKNKITITFVFTLLVVCGLLALYYLPPVNFNGSPLRKVDLLSDLRPDPVIEEVWGIERSVFFNGREKWAKGFENQRV